LFIAVNPLPSTHCGSPEGLPIQTKRGVAAPDIRRFPESEGYPRSSSGIGTTGMRLTDFTSTSGLET
jgi:hypothetical protein